MPMAIDPSPAPHRGLLSGRSLSRRFEIPITRGRRRRPAPAKTLPAGPWGSPFDRQSRFSLSFVRKDLITGGQ